MNFNNPQLESGRGGIWPQPVCLRSPGSYMSMLLRQTLLKVREIRLIPSFLFWGKKLEESLTPVHPCSLRFFLLDGQSLERVLRGLTPIMPPQGSPPGLPRAESAAPCLLCQSHVHPSIRMSIRFRINGCHSLFTLNCELFRDRGWVLFSLVSQEPSARPAAGRYYRNNGME